ncbi:MAG: hypothetical protein ORN51_07385 [Akkermansiaceae bacterium]|nr:hypothetical protein [Akkermansiaceae bacterium]
MNRRGAGIAAYLDFLQSLRQCGDTYFVEGGQAVNYWAEYIDSENPARPLEMLRPFDCHLLFYLESNTLRIERVMHGARDLPNRLMEDPER